MSEKQAVDIKCVGKRLGNTDELPVELRAQLSALKVSESESEILSVINNMYDGIANVDEILVGLYRETEKVEDRSVLVNRLYRMTKSGQIESVEKKKGVYKTK